MKKTFLSLILALSTITTWAYDAEVNGIYYDLNTETKEATVTYKDKDYNSYSGSVTVPETIFFGGATFSVTSIGYNAFRLSSGLTSVTIPNSVTSIGDGAFRGCSGLTSVTIPDLVTSIENHSFHDCSSLTSVTIPNTVTSIGDYAFENCSCLTSVTIPNSVTSIGRNGFLGCSGLTSVMIPNSVTTIGDSAFWGCSSLTSVTISNSLTSIESGTFEGCSSLTSVTIPNSVTSIGNSAFYNCSGLKKVTISASLKTIGTKVFFDCYKLSKIECLAEEAPDNDGDVFICSGNDENEIYNYAYLHVPVGSKESYASAYDWRKFKNIVDDMETSGIESINADDNAKVTKHLENGKIIIDTADGKYTLAGQRIE